MDDLLAALIASVPGHYAVWASLAITAASVADQVVPAAAPGSRWAIPRAVLHTVAINLDKAKAALAARKG